MREKGEKRSIRRILFIKCIKQVQKGPIDRIKNPAQARFMEQ